MSEIVERTTASQPVVEPVTEPVRVPSGTCPGAGGEDRAVDGLGVPADVCRRLRAGRRPRLRRGRGDGLDRPGQPGRRRARGAVRALRRAGAGRPRADAAGHSAGLGQRSPGPRSTAPAGWLPTSGPRPSWCTRRSAGSATTRPVSSRASRELATRSRRRDRRREHVPVAGPQPRGARLPARLGPGAAVVPRRHPRPVAHRHLGVGRPADGRRPRRPAARTCTWPTASARPRTSTWCPAAATSRAGSCWADWPSRAGQGTVVVEVSTRRCRNREERSPRPGRVARVRPAAPSLAADRVPPPLDAAPRPTSGRRPDRPAPRPTSLAAGDVTVGEVDVPDRTR